MEELSRLAELVTQTNDAINQAVALIEQLSQNGASPAEITALVDQLDTAKNALVAAVTANTPEPT